MLCLRLSSFLSLYGFFSFGGIIAGLMGGVCSSTVFIRMANVVECGGVVIYVVSMNPLCGIKGLALFSVVVVMVVDVKYHRPAS